MELTATHSPTRLQSLDALRGFDMFWIISGEGIFHGLAKATNAPVFNTMSSELQHTDWHGFTFYDMIFPLFIFIAGVSMPFSFAKYLHQPDTINKKIAKRKIYISLLKRTAILIVLGMIVNGLLTWQGYEHTRFASVLGRIALACFFAAIIYLNCSLRMQLVWFAILLLGYWAVMMLIPVPGFGAGVLTPEGNLSAYIDRILLPGKLYREVYDPEGILSTIPSIGSAMLGIFAGQFLKLKTVRWGPLQKSFILFGAGIVLLLLARLWNLSFPINKNIWSSSFVLYTAGWSALLLAIFYGVIDAAGFKKWNMPFVWIGTNSILIYMAAHGIINFESSAQFIFGGIINKTNGAWQQALLWTGVFLIQLVLLNFLYKKKLFLKV